LVPAGFFLATLALGQQSPNYKLGESTLNNGGNPQAGSFASSASYRITLDALGDGVAGSNQSSVSFRLDSGFVAAYPPPREVLGFRFTPPGRSSLAWDPERSAGTYNVYRALVSTLPGTFGACFQSAIGGVSTTDSASPSSGAAYFYLVTAKNRLAEEGTKGYRSSGVERSNAAPCP
jgi:hypothetical protein